VFKSDSSSLIIPEIDFEIGEGGLKGGMFTTVEGILDNAHDTLYKNCIIMTDSNTEDNKLKIFLDKLKSLKEINFEWTLILDDPLSSCFISD